MAVAASPHATRARASVRPAEKEAPSARGRLAVVSARRLAARTQRRRARLIALAAAAFVVVALLVVVTGQALVASQQVRLDNLNASLASATAANENLQLQRAELTAPGALLKIAERSLHMVTPATVTYLTPVQPGVTVAEAAAAANR
ncbi:MAG TPA: hypothetical protein VNF07_10660 [Acidimicrobiales bacterium]|nr:hypothetical protein [Acidimicrobiales bacterium]